MPSSIYLKNEQEKRSIYSDNSVTTWYNNVTSESEGQDMNLGKETETLEFKKTTGEMKEAMISISSILNKHGIGTLYFGVKPNGDVCGQDVSESSLRDVSRAVYESIRPQIYPAIEEVILDGKHLIKVEFNGNNTPYSAAGRYYLRTADEDREVTPEELKSFFVSNEYREKWEKTPSVASVKQVDKNAVKAFWQKAVSAGRIPEGRYTCPVILKRYGLVNGDSLNNAGEYLFGNTHPVTLKAAIFATDEKLTFLDMKLFEDNIYNLLGMAEDYILKNIRWRSEMRHRRFLWRSSERCWPTASPMLSITAAQTMRYVFIPA